MQIPGNNKLILINLIAKPLPFSQMHIYKDLANFFFVVLPGKGKNSLPKFNMLYDFVNNPSNCQSCCQNHCATVLSNRSMDSFQVQVLSNLKCMSSLLGNNHFLWGSLWPRHFMNCVHGECEFACFLISIPMQISERREHFCLLLSLGDNVLLRNGVL